MSRQQIFFFITMAITSDHQMWMAVATVTHPHFYHSGYLGFFIKTLSSSMSCHNSKTGSERILQILIIIYVHDIYIQYDRLRSALRTLKLAFTDVNLKSQFDLRIFSNRHPFQILRSVADLVVRVRPYVSDVIGLWFEKLRNVLRFEKWMPFWEFEKGHRFENWTPIWELETRGSVGWACVAHLSFCFEET